jgi:serine/threonine protein kinase
MKLSHYSTSVNQISYDDPTLSYELLDLIGKGSFGKVFLAKEIKSNDLVWLCFPLLFSLILSLTSQVAIKTISLDDGVALSVPVEEFLILKECKSEFVTTCFGGYLKDGFLWV